MFEVLFSSLQTIHTRADDTGVAEDTGVVGT